MRKMATVVAMGQRLLRERDLLALLLLMVSMVLLWGFVELTDEILEGETRTLDIAILKALRHPGDLSDPLGPPWVEEVFRDFTALGGVAGLTIIVAAVGGFLLLHQQVRAFLVLMASTFGGLLWSTLLKNFINRPRPELVEQFSHVSSPSFPSGHSLLSATVYLTLGALVARLSPMRLTKLYCIWVSLTITVLVGMSRVYLGVHYPSDVLGGWALGLAWAILCWFAMRQLQKRGALEHGSDPNSDEIPCSR